MPIIKPLFIIFLLTSLLSGCASIHKAAQEGDIESVKAMIAGGTDPNEKDLIVGSTALHYAAKAGNLDLVKYLVNHSANIHATERLTSFTPLHMAFAGGHLAVAQYLVAQGANIHKRGYNGMTMGHVAMQIASVSESFDSYDVEHLKWANFFGHIAVLDYYKSLGGDLNALDDDGRSLIYLPIVYAKSRLVKYLAVQGVNVNQIDKKSQAPRDWLNNPDDDVSARRYHLETVREDQGSSKDLNQELQQTQVVLKAHNAQYASYILANPGKVKMASVNTSKSFLEKAKGNVVDCLKLNAALKACNFLPWPLSTGCEKLARSEFDNMVCSHLPL